MVAIEPCQTTGRVRCAVAALAASGLVLAGCGEQATRHTHADTAAVGVDGHGGAEAPRRTTAADWKPVVDALRRTGTLMGGTVYRIPLPRRDLTVTTHGVAVAPGLALSGYAAFTRYHDRAMLMGDIVVTEAELPRVSHALQANDIEQTAIHKHLLEQSPAVWWTHIHAMGDPATLARGVKAALDITGIPPASAPPATQPPVDLDTAAIDTALGRDGTADGGIYKFTLARRQAVIADGHVLPPAAGITTAVNFQPLDNHRAAINGDIVMTADEVQPVIRSLRAGGIDVVELHNHSLDEQPRLFYLHFWATGHGADLARALRPALDATDLTPPTTTRPHPSHHDDERPH